MPHRQNAGGGELMNAYIIAMDTVAAVTLGALATGLVMVALHAPRGPYRALSLGGAVVCLLLATSSLHCLLVVAARAGLLSSHWADWLLGPMAAIEATLGVLVGVSAVVVVRQYWHRVGRAHAVVELLTDRLPSEARARQVGLTSREQEVLDLIRKGLISDREIAEVLQISPATAATHVQRILRKTGLHNRRDLMLLPRAKSAA
jgi:DNA-binding CsgD family transcriptional regulator